MKKLHILIIAVASVCILQACGGHKDSEAKADSANAAKDTSRIRPANDTDKTDAPNIEVDKKDAKFAVEAANGGMGEVALGNLAQQRAVNQKLKDFGAMMVSDHTEANNKLKALAKKLKITLPATLGKDEQKTMDDLSKKSGADFDKAYVDDMVKDHKDDIKAFEDAQKNCTDVDLKAFIANTLPVLHKHLDAIQQIHDSMK